jgi:hypothetical protein
VWVGLHVRDDLVDEIVDLSLVSARRETVDVVNASKFSDPDRPLVSVPIMINVFLDAIETIFINMDSSEVPFGRDLRLELAEPSLRCLFAHRRTAKKRSLLAQGSNQGVPITNAGGDRKACGTRTGGAVRFLEAKHVLGRICDLLELRQSSGISRVSSTDTPEHWDGDGFAWFRRIGSPIVPPADVVLQERVGITSSNASFDAVGSQGGIVVDGLYWRSVYRCRRRWRRLWGTGRTGGAGGARGGSRAGR